MATVYCDCTSRIEPVPYKIKAKPSWTFFQICVQNAALRATTLNALSGLTGGSVRVNECEMQVEELATDFWLRFLAQAHGGQKSIEGNKTQAVYTLIKDAKYQVHHASIVIVMRFTDPFSCRTRSKS